MKSILSFFFLAVPMVSTVCYAQALSDGPYLRRVSQGIEVITISGDESEKKIITSGEKIKVSFPKRKERDFEFSLHEITPQPTYYPEPEKIIAISDIGGEYNAFRDIMIKAKVIDEQNNWIYGSGHLVICGDLFDRGKQVIPFLWLLYKLEKEAELADGKLHVILGNHDIMNMAGDLRYLDKKYLKSAKIMQSAYTDLLSPKTELGRWLRSKNAIEKIGDRVYLHGGISEELLSLNLSLEQINEHCKAAYGKSKLTPKEKILMGATGPFWYRGYFMKPKINQDTVDRILKALSAKQILTGHTITSSKIKSFYNNSIIALDVNKHKGKISAMIIKNGKQQVINRKGKISELKQDPD